MCNSVRVRMHALFCESSSFCGVWLWDMRPCCLVCDDQHSGEPATSYTIEYSKQQISVTHKTRRCHNPVTIWYFNAVWSSCLLCFASSCAFFSFVVGVVRLKRSLMLQETYKFIANHPFIFVIHERRTDLTLFIGRCMKPTAVVVHHTELWWCICLEFVSILGWGGSCSQRKCWSL